MLVNLTYIKDVGPGVKMVVSATLHKDEVQVLIKIGKETPFSGSLIQLKRIVNMEEDDKTINGIGCEVYNDLLTINESFEKLLSKSSL